MIRRREFITLLGGSAAAAVVAVPLVAAAQDYPNRPVTLIVNSPPGGSTDAMARIIREPLSQALGQRHHRQSRRCRWTTGLRRSPLPSPTATRVSAADV
jgi:hypothetical protein